jgi:hypothetical protein
MMRGLFQRKLKDFSEDTKRLSKLSLLDRLAVNKLIPANSGDDPEAVKKIQLEEQHEDNQRGLYRKAALRENLRKKYLKDHLTERGLH